MDKKPDKPALDREALRARLVSLVGKATLSEERISSVSDMDELLSLWSESPRDPATRTLIEARMAAVILTLPVDKPGELPKWFMTIDPMLLPLAMLRVLFEKKAREINSRL